MAPKRGHFDQKATRIGGFEKEIQNNNLRFSHLMADKLSDELVGKSPELAENKIGQLTFYFAARKLKLFGGRGVHRL